MEKKEFDAEIEATEDQETVDPETGITLSEVMQEAVDQEVALADLEAGESITFDMPMMLASGETGTKSVTVTAGSWYYYADYRLFKVGKMLFHMDLCGGCAKETAKYVDGILFFEEGYYRGSR